MKSLIACQNEASRGLSSASRLTALSSSSSAARCAARFVPTGVRKSRILSSAVGSLFASNSDDRARDRKASMHVSRRILMTMLNAHTPLGCIIRPWYRPRDGGVVSFLHCMNDPQPEGHMASHIARRKFLAALGGAAAAWPLAARGQQAAMPVIGFVSNTSFNERQHHVAAFRDGLNDAGYVEGKNVAFEFRWVEHYLDSLAPMVADLISNRGVAIIVASGSPAVALAAKAATGTI